MINLHLVMGILFIHFIGDFVLQSRYMGMNKSSYNGILSYHCFVYSLPFIIFGWKYALLAGLLHFPVDYVTSRVTSRLYGNKEIYWFFVVIGLDQFIHSFILLYTALVLF